MLAAPVGLAALPIDLAFGPIDQALDGWKVFAKDYKARDQEDPARHNRQDESDDAQHHQAQAAADS